MATVESGDAVRVPGAADPRGWLALDASARRSPWNVPAWTDTAARRLAAGQTGPLDLLLAACHPNGYVREAAVTALGDQLTALPAGRPPPLVRARRVDAATTTYSVPEGPRTTELSALLTRVEPVLGRRTAHLLRFYLNLT